MKTNEKVIKDLKEEKYQLMRKLQKLNAFRVSEDFENVLDVQRELLPQQYDIMIKYLDVLTKRITDLSEEIRKND